MEYGCYKNIKWGTLSHLIEVIDHEADVRVGHLLALALRVHLAAAGRRVHLHKQKPRVRQAKIFKQNLL